MKLICDIAALLMFELGSRFYASLICALCCFSLVAAFGCGDGRPQRVHVAGKVTIDGQPLGGAMMTFYPPAGRPSYATTNQSGDFTLACFEDRDGAQLGIHQVTVMAVEQPNPATMKWLAPKKYSDRNQSGLQYTIDKPIDDLKVELTWNGGRPFIERSGVGD